MHTRTAVNSFARLTSTCLAICVLAIFAGNAGAQQPSTASPEQYQTQTELPGIVFQITAIQRLTPTRLVLMVWIQATKETPASGVFIGTPAEIPGGVPKNMEKSVDVEKYLAKPFTMAGATMKDEISGVDYPILPTVQPHGIACRPATALGPLLPNHMQVISLQFAIPPPPPAPAPGQKPPLQKLSFLFPRAKGAILHVPLPPVPQYKKP